MSDRHRNGCEGPAECQPDPAAYPLCWTAEQVDDDQQQRHFAIGKGPGWSCPACRGEIRVDQLPPPLLIAHQAHVKQREALEARVQVTACDRRTDPGDPS